MPKKIVIITSSFPYYPGEQFFETEVRYWGNYKDIELVIMPLRTSSEERRRPQNFFLDLTLADKHLKRFDRTISLLKVFISSLFFKECIREVTQNPKRLLYTVTSFMKYCIYKKELAKFIKNSSKSNLFFYTFWYNEATYALQALKKKFDFKLVTRVHGADLYQERHKYNYIPFRRQFSRGIDTIYTITTSANEYLSKTHGFDKKIIKTSRLGVNDYGIVTTPSGKDHFHIVSCSFLVKVKRVDKIIDAIEKFSRSIKDIKIIWTHIGSGPLEAKLRIYANAKLKNKKNVSHFFLGELQHKDVYNFYKRKKVDVFINVSESEGVPISIMEAMSCHIPIIAPNVGGIGDMVIDAFNGILLSSKSEIDEIVSALGNIEFFKDKKNRKKSYAIFNEKYNANNNYNNFIQSFYVTR